MSENAQKKALKQRVAAIPLERKKEIVAFATVEYKRFREIRPSLEDRPWVIAEARRVTREHFSIAEEELHWIIVAINKGALWLG